MKTLFAILATLASFATLRADDTGIVQAIGDRAPTTILRMIPDMVPVGQQLASLLFIGGYQAIDRDGVPLTPDQAARLSAAVKAPGAFDTTEPEAKMRPGITYRFGAGADAVDMLVCFSCDKVSLVPVGKDTIAATGHIAQATREVLLSIAKEALPKDEAIQELPAVRSENAVPAPAVPVPEGARRPQAPAPQNP